MQGYICDSCNRIIVDGNERLFTIGADGEDYYNSTIIIGGCDTGRKVLHFCNKHCMEDFVGTCIAKSKPNQIVHL